MRNHGTEAPVPGGFNLEHKSSLKSISLKRSALGEHQLFWSHRQLLNADNDSCPEAVESRLYSESMPGAAISGEFALERMNSSCANIVGINTLIKPPARIEV